MRVLHISCMPCPEIVCSNCFSVMIFAHVLNGHDPVDLRQRNQRYETDEHLVLHNLLAVYSQPAQVKAFLQTEKSSLDNILFPVDEHCFFGVVDIVADDNPTCGFEFAAYDILGYLPFAKKL